MIKTLIISLCLAFAYYGIVPLMCKSHDLYCRFCLACFVATAIAWTIEDILKNFGVIS